MDRNMEMNIYQKIAKIRQSVGALKKDSSGYNYKYVSDEGILPRVQAGMDKYNIVIIPKIVSGTLSVTPYSYRKKKLLKGGGEVEEIVNDILVRSDMYFEVISADNPDDKIEVPWALVGQQSDASQAFGSGLTYVTRYFMLKFFQVPTTSDDPDALMRKKKDAEEALKRESIASVIDDIDELVNRYLRAFPDGSADHQKAREALTDVIKKYVKDGGKPSADYRKVKTIRAAVELLNALKKQIGGEEE